MDNSKQQNQTRFMLAAVLSMAVLFGWTYFFAPPKPTDNANTATVVDSSTKTPTPEQPTVQQQTQAVQQSPDDQPNRQITIKSPLYEVKLDSRGALATSWVLLKDKSPQGERPLYADGSNENNQKPLQLISQEALSRTPREIPFRLSTGDAALDESINNRNYQISISEDNIALNVGEEKRIDFVLNDPATGVEATKSFLFRSDNYVADLGVKLTRNGQIVPNTKLLIGASIGDHAINYHNLYHIESEAVAFAGGDIYRNQGAGFTYNAQNQSIITVPGNVDWAGVGDAYFAMAAIPAAQTQGLEYTASKYQVQTEPFYYSIFSWIFRSATTEETRHLITAHVPVNADGSVTKIYAGTKDYFALSEQYSESLSKEVGRTIDLVDLINFSNYSLVRWFVKPLSIPIVYALNFFNNFTHNYGVAIILFTFLFYSLLFPLRWSQSKSFKKASANAPKMKEIQDKIKDLQKQGVPLDDPRMRELQMEQLRMTKAALPIGGCLPMLLQFPLLIAFYTAVTVSLGIRQASFLWLPDLSAGDPYHLLEFAFAGSMILAMKFTPQGAVVSPEQAMQQKMMTYLMPVMMLYVMWSAPAGLLLYWFFGNVVSFGQQMIINKMNKTGEPPKEEIVDSMPKNTKNIKKVKPKLSTS